MKIQYSKQIFRVYSLYRINSFQQFNYSKYYIAPTLLQTIWNIAPTLLQKIRNIAPTLLQRIWNIAPTLLHIFL